VFAAKHSLSLIHEDISLAIATHAPHVLIVSLAHSHSTHSSVLLHYHSFVFTAKHSSSLFHDNISLATHVLVVSLVHHHAFVSHTHVLVVSIVVSLVHHHALVAHSHVLVVSLVHHHVLVAHSHVLVVSLVHHHALVAHTHVLIHHHASIHKLRSEVEFTCWHSEVEDFDPLFMSPVARKSLQWQFTRSNDGCSVSI
jgi:hypothetical protein